MRDAVRDLALICVVALCAFMVGFVSASEALAPPKEAAPTSTLRGAQP